PKSKPENRNDVETVGKKLSSVVSEGKNVRVVVAADEAVAYKEVIAAMNAIKHAKIEKVSLMTQAEANARWLTLGPLTAP
ncbi:biopolymer transporter ExbD, partial [Xylella fastidiosa]|uniref:biopolymer transporter ExbD n=1 Tax=Xylella fastidiosa TaxID=2371 RepID=UPI001326CE47|nr:hypothetical protein [Xylella fastidiosa subsp. multiplex]